MENCRVEKQYLLLMFEDPARPQRSSQHSLEGYILRWSFGFGGSTRGSSNPLINSQMSFYGGQVLDLVSLIKPFGPLTGLPAGSNGARPQPTNDGRSMPSSHWAVRGDSGALCGSLMLIQRDRAGIIGKYSLGLFQGWVYFFVFFFF